MDKKKNDFLFIIIFIVITGTSLLYLSKASYAKYKRQVDANVQNRISSWNIKVNNESINNKTTLSSEITPTIEENQYVKEGTLAPGTTGYFDIIIDATEVDVDFTYTITGKTNDETPLLDLLITDYEIDGIKTSYEDGKPLSGTLQKNTGNTPIRIYFKWNDDENNIMDNSEDTKYAIDPNNEITKIKVSITFNQKN